MKGSNLGEFEELVLLVVGILYDDAYSVAIQSELAKQSGRKVKLGAVHAAVYRLEKKGMLNSRMGEATSVRGGKRKRIFTLSESGKIALRDMQETRSKMMAQIPGIVFEKI